MPSPMPTTSTPEHARKPGHVQRVTSDPPARVGASLARSPHARLWLQLCPWLCLCLCAGALGCGDDAAGGDANSGGNGAASCREFEACGGELEGRWRVREVCFLNPEVIFEDLAPGGECADWLVELNTQADGAREYGADTVDANLALTLDLQTYWDKDCIRATLGEDAPINSNTCASWERALTEGSMTASCVLRDDGCDCLLTREDESEGSGSYSVAGDKVSENGEPLPYCVAGDRLTLSIERGGLLGNIVFSRD